MEWMVGCMCMYFWGLERDCLDRVIIVSAVV